MANVNCHLEHWFHPGDGKRYADPKCRLEHWPHPPRSKKVRVKRDTGEVMVSRYQKDKKRHPYQQAGEEWRIPPPSRNMGCCSADIYNALFLLNSLADISPEEGFDVRLGGLLTPRELLLAAGGLIASHFDRMAEDCNNAGVTSKDYEEWGGKMRGLTTARDAQAKASEVRDDLGKKLRLSAQQGNCR